MSDKPSPPLANLMSSDPVRQETALPQADPAPVAPPQAELAPIAPPPIVAPTEPPIVAPVAPPPPASELSVQPGSSEAQQLPSPTATELHIRLQNVEAVLDRLKELPLPENAAALAGRVLRLEQIIDHLMSGSNRTAEVLEDTVHLVERFSPR